MIFGADLINKINNQVQVLLNSFNNKLLERTETTALIEFGEIQRIGELVKWITSNPIWVNPTVAKDKTKRR